MQNLEKSRSDW